MDNINNEYIINCLNSINNDLNNLKSEYFENENNELDDYLFIVADIELIETKINFLSEKIANHIQK